MTIFSPHGSKIKQRIFFPPKKTALHNTYHPIQWYGIGCSNFRCICVLRLLFFLFGVATVTERGKLLESKRTQTTLRKSRAIFYDIPKDAVLTLTSTFDVRSSNWGCG